MSSTSSGSVDSYDYVGGFAGSNNGTILSSTSSQSVNGEVKVGGFVGADSNGTYSENLYCQISLVLPAVGNNDNITGITTYDKNCEFILISNAGNLQAINENLSRLV